MSERRRDRLRRMREQRMRRDEPDGAISSIKFAGFGAALLVFLAVAVGFRSDTLEDLTSSDEGAAGRAAWLLEHGLFGVTLLEWIVGLLAGAFLAVSLWRGLRR